MLKRICFISLFVIFQSTVFADTCDTIESVNWLVGNWHYENSELKINESWKRVSAKTMEGYGQTESVKKNEIVSAETLRLVEMSGEVFYLAKVASNKLPVPFKLTSCVDKTAIFENTEHDFPKKIAYRLTGRNNIAVSVTGDKGKGFKIEYTREEES